MSSHQSSAPRAEYQINVHDPPLRITEIQVEGSRATNPKIPKAYLQIFNDCRTLSQLNPAAASVAAQMVATGHYKDVQFSFIPDNETNDFSNNVRIFCQVKEADQFGFMAGVNQSPDATAAEGSLTLWKKNLINGYGERLEIQMAQNYKKTAGNFSIALVDLHNTMNSKIGYEVRYSHSDLTREWVSGHNEKTNALLLAGTTFDNTESLQYLLALRTANPISQQPEAEIVKSAYQPNLKSAIRYINTRNLLDNDATPRNGTFHQLTTELSGLLGDVHAVKFGANYHYHKPIPNSRRDSTFSLTFRGGVQQPFRNILNVLTNRNYQNTDQFDPEESYQDIPIFDRFFGGYLNTRGISPEAMGPKAGRHAFGSDAYASVTAMVSCAIPGYESLPIRPHVFANASNFTSLSTILRNRYGGVQSPLSDVSHTTASLGVGLSFALMGASHIEVNVGSQIKNKKILKPTLSIGLSSTMDW